MEEVKTLFTHLIKISVDHGDRYYLKSTIDEQNMRIDVQLTNLKNCWTGKLDGEQIRLLSKKFPKESKDSFYSHTHFAFSHGNHDEKNKRTYAFTSKKLNQNQLEFTWKEKIDDLNSLKTVGMIILEEKSNDEILANLFDYAIEEIKNQKAVNEQQVDELQRTNTQLNKALETIKRTVDLKEQLETDLYRKVRQ